MIMFQIIFFMCYVSEIMDIILLRFSKLEKITEIVYFFMFYDFSTYAVEMFYGTFSDIVLITNLICFPEFSCVPFIEIHISLYFHHLADCSKRDLEASSYTRYIIPF